MSYKADPTLCQAMLAAAKAELDAGFCFIFSGPEPVSAQAPLNMDDDHTELVKLSLNGDGVTGLTFAAAVGALLAKPGGAVWKGTNAFDGADPATTQNATFFRFGEAGDDCRDAGTTPRLQGSAGGPASTADMKLTTASLTDNDTDETGVVGFNFRLFNLA